MSGVRSGGVADDEGPRSPPNPPSPRAKIDRRVLHSGLPSISVTVVSLTKTAAVPLSQMSVNRVVARAVPLAGNGPATLTASLPCSTLLSSMSTPGKFTFGGSVRWKLAATLLKVGRTWGRPSVR